MAELVLKLDGFPIGNAKRRRADAFPKLAQAVDAPFRRVAGDDRGIDRPDGNSRNPIRMQSGFGQALINPGLIRAESATALEQQGNLFELRSGLWQIRRLRCKPWRGLRAYGVNAPDGKLMPKSAFRRTF